MNIFARKLGLTMEAPEFTIKGKENGLGNESCTCESGTTEKKFLNLRNYDNCKMPHDQHCQEGIDFWQLTKKTSYLSTSDDIPHPRLSFEIGWFMLFQPKNFYDFNR
jgi:hypothetical protein